MINFGICWWTMSNLKTKTCFYVYMPAPQYNTSAVWYGILTWRPLGVAACRVCWNVVVVLEDWLLKVKASYCFLPLWSLQGDNVSAFKSETNNQQHYSLHRLMDSQSKWTKNDNKCTKTLFFLLPFKGNCTDSGSSDLLQLFEDCRCIAHES